MVQSIDAIFSADAKSPSILTLANQLTGELLQRLTIGDVPHPGHDPVDFNSVTVKLPLSDTSDVSKTLAETEQWLEGHASALAAVDGRKSIEFWTYLDSNTGSRTLTVPHSIVRLCADLGLDIANQAMRVFTKSEYEAIRAL